MILGGGGGADTPQSVKMCSEWVDVIAWGIVYVVIEKFILKNMLLCRKNPTVSQVPDNIKLASGFIQIGLYLEKHT